MNIDPIIEKLRKLIAHEKSARSIGNLHEAEAFAARIQTMLEDHKLGMDEVAYAEREAAEPIDWEPVSADDIDHTDTYNRKNVRQYWQHTLATAIAEVNSCRAIGKGGDNSRFSFVGRTTDRQLCKILFIYMVELAEELCAKAAKEDVADQRDKFNEEKFGYGMNRDVPPWAAPAFRGWMKDYRKAWRKGFSEAVCTRLYAQHAAAEVKSAGTAAMVHLKKDTIAVNDFLKGKVRAGTKMRVSGSNEDGYARGKSTGSAVNLSPNRFAPKSAGRIVGLLGS